MEPPNNDPVRRKDLKEFREELLKEIRIEFISTYLGDDKIISEEEAAFMLGVSKRTMYRLRKAGEIHCGVLAGKPMYSVGQIKRFMRETVRP